jgi:hypothetical protein
MIALRYIFVTYLLMMIGYFAVANSVSYAAATTQTGTQPTQLQTILKTLTGYTGSVANIPGDQTATILSGGVDPQTSTADIEFLCQRAPGKCDRIKLLNPVFRERIAKALRAAEQATGARTVIRSAFRTSAEQVSAYNNYRAGGGLAARPGTSYHEKGLAVDISTQVIYTWLHTNGPTYGVINPPSIRGRDPVHIQIMNCDANCAALSPASSGTAGLTDGSTLGSSNPLSQWSQLMQGLQSAQAQQAQTGQTSGTNPYSSNSGSNSQYGSQFGNNAFSPINGLSGNTNQGLSEDFYEEMSLSCNPVESNLSRVQVSWECPSGTRSRGLSQPAISTFTTKGAIRGLVSVTPTTQTIFQVQCLRNTTIVAEQECSFEPTTTVGTTLKPRLSLSASVDEVRRGETVDIEWSTSYTQSCSVVGGGIDATGPRGLQTSDPLQSTTTFELSCVPRTGGEAVVRTITVTVTNPR